MNIIKTNEADNLVLWQAFQQGDEQAYTAIYRQQVRAMDRYGMSLVPVSEAFVFGGFPTSLNRDRITPEYVAANPNDTFSALRNMPRAYFLTASFKF